MEQSHTPFKLPSLGELKTLNEEQLKPIFFELERHRANELLSASVDYTDRVERIEKEYANDFQVLADALEKLKSKTA